MMSNNQFTYAIDLVLCIDCTGSMRQTLQGVKDAALEFHEILRSKMETSQKSVDRLRVRVVAFRDLYADDPAFESSPFFVLPDEAPQFQEFLAPLKAKGGGGDGPESGLEALAMAMNSDWSTDSDRLRQVIVVWTDAAPHPLEKAADRPDLLQKTPVIAKSFDELTDQWEAYQGGPMNFQARRLVVFAPDKGHWAVISHNWEQMMFFPSKAGQGLRDFEMDQMMSMIANTL